MAQDEEYEPRPHDHLVEPFFGGLGEGEPQPAATRRRWPWALLALGLLVALYFLLGR